MPKETDKIIEPINGSLDAVAKAVVKTARGSRQAASSYIKNNMLAVKSPPRQAAPNQIPLDLGIEVQRDINGIEMGVLENGIPYLTQRGLANVTGAARSLIQAITKEWEDHYQDEVIGKDRISFFKQYLLANGFNEPTLHIVTMQDGSVHYAYPDVVCMAFLEYYAFESKGDNTKAIESYRKFASFGLRRFIYDALGYSPEQKVLDGWRHFHDRVDITQNAAPIGFWGVFKEIAVMIVPMIRSGIMISDKVVPDISVGKAWSEYWQTNNLESQYGTRTRYDHEYPDYYPQAKSNPQPSFAYPNAALGEFRNWLQKTYILSKFPKYLFGQTTKGTIPLQVANKAIEAFGGQQIEHKQKVATKKLAK